MSQGVRIEPREMNSSGVDPLIFQVGHGLRGRPLSSTIQRVKPDILGKRCYSLASPIKELRPYEHGCTGQYPQPSHTYPSEDIA